MSDYKLYTARLEIETAVLVREGTSMRDLNTLARNSIQNELDNCLFHTEVVQMTKAVCPDGWEGDSLVYGNADGDTTLSEAFELAEVPEVKWGTPKVQGRSES